MDGEPYRNAIDKYLFLCFGFLRFSLVDQLLIFGFSRLPSTTLLLLRKEASGVLVIIEFPCKYSGEQHPHSGKYAIGL